ncbi:MAG: hypothetical protein CMJ23_15215, partial [Phycisphaerae bacterium]|nr:hypothetical protein [Phycisphaerae bacterium]
MATKPAGDSKKPGSGKKVRKTSAKSAGKSAAKAGGSSLGTTKKRRKISAAVDPEAKAKIDARTVDRIESLGASVVKQSLKLADPFVDVPTRSISNVRFNKSKRLLEMGDAKQRRMLFNLGQA